MVAWRNIPFAFAVSAMWMQPDTLQLMIVDPSLGWSASLLTVGGGWWVVGVGSGLSGMT